MAAKRDYYEVLGVNRSVGADELKKAFRKLAMQYHPDKNPGDKKAEERFKELGEAYETLSDPQKRQAYDQFGHMGAQAGFKPGAGNPFEGFARQGATGGPGGFENFGGFGSNANSGANAGADASFQDLFGDIFGDLFNGRPAGGPRPGGPSAQRPGQARGGRGADLRYTLNISFEEAATGAEKTISFIRQRAGKEDPAKLAITVPAGVKAGQRLKIRGEGDSGAGGVAGDLYVIINIQEHPVFRRVDDDVHLDLPLSYQDAVFGTSADVPTLTGKASLKIPAFTPAGQVFRLKGKGFASVSGPGTGDLLVRVVIDVPRELTDEQRDLLKKFSSTLKPSPLIKAYNDKVDRLLKTKK